MTEHEPTHPIAIIVGNPRAGSRTHRVAERAARTVGAAAGLPAEPAIIDLAALAPVLLAAQRPAAVTDALQTALAADVLVVASPTYKGTYTGLLKVFLDHLGTGSLAGTVALPLLLMGLPQHALAVDVHLRPLLVELGATVPTPGLAVLESDLDRLDEVLTGWAAKVAPTVRALLAPPPR
jgi:FMN reductase